MLNETLTFGIATYKNNVIEVALKKKVCEAVWYDKKKNGGKGRADKTTVLQQFVLESNLDVYAEGRGVSRAEEEVVSELAAAAEAASKPQLRW
ncbi:unnamed protein product [Arctia plantaginis]|uniref:Uncharacterized protein n=1 Tax=Arctia plantaginis TaxID=874455 RepID=A0A8S0YUV6_ARCPL|nr:unnamed protein product [Arctia plantaginis]